MAIYAIGDVQGCHHELLQLVKKINFNPATDTLWFVGDLVNRGPNSLETLRFVRSLGDSAVVVLGNHDLHLLAIAAGIFPPKKSDTLQEILQAPDAQDLLAWLKSRRLAHYQPELNTLMVHGGVAPDWDVATVLRCARDVELTLQNRWVCQAFLENMYGNEPTKWDDRLIGWPRLRFITNALTRMRYCHADGSMELNHKLGLNAPASEDLIPWFQIEGRKTQTTRVIFGHWSTLGLYQSNNVVCVDTGCVWGGKLTAYRLDTKAGATEIVQQESSAARALDID